MSGLMLACGIAAGISALLGCWMHIQDLHEQRRRDRRQITVMEAALADKTALIEALEAGYADAMDQRDYALRGRSL